MRRLRLGIPVIVAVLLVPSFSRDVPVNGAAGFRSIQVRNLRADVEFLTSEALEGRRSLERGSDAAIEFCTAELAKAGLKPLDGRSFRQKVPLIEYRVDREATRLTLLRNGKTVWEHGKDFWGGAPDEVTVRAPVVFAGYGITAPEFRYDDYAGLDVRGKIVLVFDHEPQEEDPSSVFNGVGNTRHANSLMKLLNAQRRGAVGLLLVPEPNRRHRSAQDRMKTVPGGEVRMRRLAPQALADSEARIPMLTISDAAAAALLRPSGRTPSQIQTSIDGDLKPASMPLPETSLEMRIVLEERRRGTSANVLGMIEGSDPVLKAETIIFCAHYDHDGMWDGMLRPGADDDASGTAAVLELARAFAANPSPPKRTVVFALWAAEERGLLGAYHYTAHPLRPLETTRAVINFDMIGRNEAPSPQTDGLIHIAEDTSNELNLVGTNYSPGYREAVENWNALVGLDLNYKWDKDSALNVFQRSDQFPFALREIPAVWWFTGFHPDYHQTTDTADKINWTKMEKIVKLAYLAGWEFADGNRPPKFVATPGAPAR